MTCFLIDTIIGSFFPNKDVIMPSSFPTNTLPSNEIQNVNQRFSPSSIDISGRDCLLLGEGNYSFAITWVSRRIKGIGVDSERPQPNFGSRVIATNYSSYNECRRTIPNFDSLMNTLKSLNILALFGIDATQIDKHFEGHRFSRIQWNCPDISTPFCEYPPQLSNTLADFFDAASPLQDVGDRTHVTLITPKKMPNSKVWQSMHYGIVDAVEGSGYALSKIKPSGPIRYVDLEGNSKYEHQKTYGNTKVLAFEEGVSEFIFQRLSNIEKGTHPSNIETYNGFRKFFSSDGRFYETINTEGYYYNNTTLSDPESTDSEGDDSFSLDADQN